MLQGGRKTHRLRAVAVDLVVELHAVAFDESFLVGQLCAHGITSSLEPRFGHADEVADPPQRLAHRRALLLEAEQIEAFRADEGVGDEGGDLLGA